METMQPTPIAPETPIAVTLQAQEWNAVIAVLSDAPYKIVAAIIGKTVQQMQAGAASAALAPDKPNGEDHAGTPGAFR